MGFLNAAKITDFLILKGLNFRDAHYITGSIILYCEEKNKSIQDLELKDLNLLSSFFDESLYEYIEYDKSTDEISA